MSSDPKDKGKPCPTRRNFLSLAGWASFGISMSGMGAGSARFMWPNVLYEPDTSIKIGRESEIPEGVTLNEKEKFFIFRAGSDIHVISAVCEHLGCTVAWGPESKIFDCPCHGSRYRENGRNFAGPAPRPLKWFKITKARDGQLVVHKSVEMAAGFKFTVAV